MKQLIATLTLAAAASVTAGAHFVFVVPQANDQSALVMLSETLQPDAQVGAALIAQTRLSLRDHQGRETPLALSPAEHAFRVAVPAAASGVVHGTADLGVMRRGRAAHLLLYHPKTILGDPFDARTRLGAGAPVELVPSGRPGALVLQLVAGTQPLADAEVTVLLPGGSERVVKTDPQGRTEPFPQPGRYGAWARHWVPTPGERDGKAYSEVRHYATLVIDVPAVQASSAEPRATALATLPEPASSFGAVATDGWLYVYGGHISPTHVYSTAAVSGRFSRVRLPGTGRWESLPPGPPVQGMNLAAFEGRVYRVGGMQPQNSPAEPQDTRSLADVARFDPATGRWEALAPLPAPRSSHDVVVSGHRLFVVGGWNLRGRGSKPEWPATMEVLDLASPSSRWESVPQPFRRRAFIAAATAGRIYVMGGFDDADRVVQAVDVYDTATGTWSAGPLLPGGAASAFGPAAAVVNGRLVVSIGDGSLHRLTSDGRAWERVGQASPRIVHRLVPDGDRVLILGGARGGANLDLIESLPLRP